jgi:hypothetical protein
LSQVARRSGHRRGSQKPVVIERRLAASQVGGKKLCLQLHRRIIIQGPNQLGVNAVGDEALLKPGKNRWPGESVRFR